MPPRVRRYSPLAARRRAMGYSQEKLAEDLVVDRATVARWERGDTEPQPSLRPQLAKTLKISLDELAQLLNQHNVQADILGVLRPSVGEVRDAALLERGPRELIDSAHLDNAREKIGELLRAEDIFGGAQVASLAYDSAESLDRRIRVAGVRPGLERDACAIAAELYEVSGWLFVDAANHDLVRTANSKAIQYCALAGDRGMETFVTQNMSMHAVETGQASEGLTLARSMLDRQLSPRVETLFHVREARALAALGDMGAKQAFARASALYLDGVRDSDPYWTWWVNHAQMLIQEGCLLLDIGEWGKAIDVFQGYLQGVVKSRPGSGAIVLAHMAHAMARAGAWRDAETVTMELLGDITAVSPRAHVAIRDYAGTVARSSTAPSAVRDIARALTSSF